MLGMERTRSSDKSKPKKSTTKSSPVVSYDPEPRSSRKAAEPRSASRDNNNNNNAYVEPARTPKDGEKRSRHRSERYEVVEVAPKYEQGGPVRLPERQKRGSLYESDMRRPRREYRIEERVPDRGERERESEKDREERHERRRREREREWRDEGR